MGLYPYYIDYLEIILEVVTRFKIRAIIRRKEYWWSTYDDFGLYRPSRPLLKIDENSEYRI